MHILDSQHHNAATFSEDLNKILVGVLLWSLFYLVCKFSPIEKLMTGV